MQCNAPLIAGSFRYLLFNSNPGPFHDNSSMAKALVRSTHWSMLRVFEAAPSAASMQADAIQIIINRAAILLIVQVIDHIGVWDAPHFTCSHLAGLDAAEIGHVINGALNQRAVISLQERVIGMHRYFGRQVG
jgi:hypothetical protein